MEWEELYEKYGRKNKKSKKLLVISIVILLVSIPFVYVFFLYEEGIGKTTQELEQEGDKMTPPTIQPSPSSTESQFSPLKTWSVAKGSVLIFADDKYYSLLREKIERFASDINKEFSIVEIRHGSEWEKYEIKEVIKEWYNTKNLSGLFLIGDIPTGWFVGIPHWSVGTDTYPDDKWFKDLDGTCELLERKVVDGKERDVFNLSSCSFYNDIWVSRLLPPRSMKNDVDLLSDYLDRNHAYRLGEKSYSRGAFFASSEQICIDNYKSVDGCDLGTMLGVKNSEPELFNGNSKFFLIRPDNKEQFLRELEQTDVEYTQINAHGSPIYHEYLYSEDVRLRKAGPMAYEFFSCSVGRYTNDDYIAGWYLYGGEGLVSTAATTPIFVITALPTVGVPEPASLPIMLLDKGYAFSDFAPLSKMFSEAGKWFNSNTFLGDPTLSFRRPTEELSILSTSESVLSFGNIDLDSGKTYEKNFTIQNIGDKTVIVRSFAECSGEPWYFTTGGLFQFSWQIWPEKLNISIVGSALKMPPNSSMPFTFKISTQNVYEEVQKYYDRKKTYDCNVIFFSDSESPVQYLPFSFRWV